MHHVISADGSRIAFDQRGSGEAVVIVDGALCSREVGPSADTAKALSDEFTVVTYDRRGRGGSTDESAGRFEVEREIEDLAALLDHLGGHVSLIGFSSGGGLAIEAAGRIPGVRRVIAYEVPYITDPAEGVPPDYAERLGELVRADQRSAAVRYFLRVVGMPAPLVALMRLTPPFQKLKRVAHTLPYDAAIVVDALGPDRRLTAERWATVKAPVTVLAGAKSPASMRRANAELAAVLGADHAELAGLNHMVKGRTVAPALAERLRAPVATRAPGSGS
jgi:pimeloyl-ACP methyl ester carboxylesterase